MSSDENNPPQSPPSRVRRSSFAGETFANLFGSGQRASVSRSTSVNEGNGSHHQQQQQQGQNYGGSITSAAAQAQRRRLSLTTLGLSGSPNQSSPFGSYSGRRDSYGTASNDSIDESAIEDEPATGPTPQTPFARRMSFGAKALRDVRTGGGGNTPPGQQSGTNGEGFNWSDNFRTRAERTSIASGAGLSSSAPKSMHGRAQSVAVMEPPVREMPKPKEQVRPDHFQERILKGDFYMD